MTIKEIFDEARDSFSPYEVIDHGDYLEVIKRAEDAVSNLIKGAGVQVPKEVMVDKDTYSGFGGGFLCICGGSVFSDENFCSQCGSKLNWGGVSQR